MRHRLVYILLFLIIFSVNRAFGADKQTTVYMFGFAASFNDSTVYFTDIQEVNGAWVDDSKKKFLVSRTQYSNQFRDFIKQNKNVDNPTCVTFYSLKRGALEKKLAKVRKLYTAQPKKKKKKKNVEEYGFAVMGINPGEFTYKVVEPIHSETTTTQQPPKKKGGKGRGPGGPGGPGNGNPPSGGPGGGMPPGGGR